MNISKRVYARVDLDIIEENLNKIHNMTSPDTGIYAVVRLMPMDMEPIRFQRDFKSWIM